MPEERLVLPPVSTASWQRYQDLVNAPLGGMRNGVLPNIEVTLRSYAALADSLANPDGGGYEDDDQTDLAEYHPKSIALVAPAIAGLIAHMQAMIAIARSVDAGFMAAGRAPLFGVRMPEEQPQ